MLLLLTPRYHALRNRLTRLAPGDGVKTIVLGLLGVGFWAFMYGVSFKVLTYFRTIEGLGDLLALRLLSMILLTFFSILVFSNIVTSLSTFYLSGELDLLLSSPVRIESIYRAKFIETLMDSSWMTLIYGLPVFIAYGTVFKAPLFYYAGLAFTIIPFLIIPAAVGIIVTMLLVNAFPARRAKDVLVLLGLLFFVVLYILFRMLRPERLVDPEAFPTLVQYLTAMRGPVSPLLPTSWATEALSPLLKGSRGETVFTSSCSGVRPWRASSSANGPAGGFIIKAGRGPRKANGRNCRARGRQTPFSGLCRPRSGGRCAPWCSRTSSSFPGHVPVVPALSFVCPHGRVPLQLQALAPGALAHAHVLPPEPDLLPEPGHGGVLWCPPWRCGSCSPP